MNNNQQEAIVFFKKHINFFITLISRFHPLNSEIIVKFHDKLDWTAIKYSENML